MYDNRAFLKKNQQVTTEREFENFRPNSFQGLRCLTVTTFLLVYFWIAQWKRTRLTISSECCYVENCIEKIRHQEKKEVSDVSRAAAGDMDPVMMMDAYKYED